MEPAEQSPTAEADAEAPAASESLTGVATEPVTAPGDALAPEEAERAEAIAAAEAEGDPDAATAADAAVAAEAAPTTAEAVATIDAANVEAPKEEHSRRKAAGRALRTLLTVAIGLGLLVVGLAIGSMYFQSVRPATGPPPGLVGTTEDQPPPVVREFIAALQANDFDALRSSLPRDPHIDLTDELERFGITQIDGVEVLGTHVAEARSATEILLQYKREDGVPFAINLVVLADGGQIEGFR